MHSATMDFGNENTRGEQVLECLGIIIHHADQRLHSDRTRSSDPSSLASSRDPTRETYPCPFPSPMAHQNVFSHKKQTKLLLAVASKPLESLPRKMTVSWLWWARAQFMIQPQPLSTAKGYFNSRRSCPVISALSCAHTSRSQGRP